MFVGLCYLSQFMSALAPSILLMESPCLKPAECSIELTFRVSVLFTFLNIFPLAKVSFAKGKMLGADRQACLNANFAGHPVCGKMLGI